MPELISEETFDNFLSSDWPMEFSSMAQKASAQGVAIDKLGSFGVYQTNLILVRKDEQQMLKDMGITEDELLVKRQRASWRTIFSKRRAEDSISPNVCVPRYTQFGKELIAMCEDLYTPEEHAEANAEARANIPAIRAEIEAMLKELKD
jgi:hypothetical protein